MRLPSDLKTSPSAAGRGLTPASRQSNHAAFSPLGCGDFSPALLPLRKARTHAKLAAAQAAAAAASANKAAKLDGSTPSPERLRGAPLTASRELLTAWAGRYLQ